MCCVISPLLVLLLVLLTRPPVLLASFVSVKNQEFTTGDLPPQLLRQEPTSAGKGVGATTTAVGGAVVVEVVGTGTHGI